MKAVALVWAGFRALLIWLQILICFSRVGQSDGEVTLDVHDLNRFLEEQKRSFTQKSLDIAKIIPDNGKIITIAEANLMVKICISFQQLLNIYFYSGYYASFYPIGRLLC